MLMLNGSSILFLVYFILFDGVVILQQLKSTRSLKMWAKRAKKQWLGARCATSVHFSFFSREAMFNCTCRLTSHVAKLVLRWRRCLRAKKYWPTVRLRDKCALRPWQRRWLSLSAHFNQPLLLSRGRSLQIRLQRSRNIGSSLCSKAGAIFSLQEAMLCSTCTLALHVVMRAIAQNCEAFRCGQSE